MPSKELTAISLSSTKSSRRYSTQQRLTSRRCQANGMRSSILSRRLFSSRPSGWTKSLLPSQTSSLKRSDRSSLTLQPSTSETAIRILTTYHRLFSFSLPVLIPLLASRSLQRKWTCSQKLNQCLLVRVKHLKQRRLLRERELLAAGASSRIATCLFLGCHDLRPSLSR